MLREWYCWARLWVIILHTRCALVSAWPANAAVSFQLVTHQIGKGGSAGISCYSSHFLRVVGNLYCVVLPPSMMDDNQGPHRQGRGGILWYRDPFTYSTARMEISLLVPIGLAD